MGLYDYPQKQQQPEFELDYFLSNIAVLGGPLSGKTTFMKSFLVQITRAVIQYGYKENIYIIDFGGSLGDYGNLPNVCACFNGRNEEDIKRVFKTIDNELDKKLDVLKNQNFNKFFQENFNDCPQHTTLIIENLNSFLSDERYASYQEKLHQFCRDGLSKGLTVVVSANELSGISRLLSNFSQKVVFDMPTDNYFEIFNSKVLKPMKLPGRGLINRDSSVFEFQCILPFPCDEAESLNRLIEESGKKISCNKLLSFPVVLTTENFAENCTGSQIKSSENITVGLDYYTHYSVDVDIKQNRAIAIYGKRQFGKTNLLRLLLNKLKQNKNCRFVYLDDGREELLEFFDSANDKISNFYFTEVAEFRDFLVDNGYGGTYSSSHPQKGKSGFVEKTPFTVFVLQNKSLFLSAIDSKFLMGALFPDMISKAEARNFLFIFSDVRRFSGELMDVRSTFNNSISTAFLLDNIGDFVNDKGKNTVFGEMDPKELKAEYAKCSIGDGYFYDVSSDNLQKIKFLHTKNF